MKISFRILVFLVLLSVISVAAVRHPYAPAADGGSFPTSTPTSTPEPPIHETPTSTPEPTALPTATETPLVIEAPADASIRDGALVATTAPTQAPANPSAASQLMPVITIGLIVFVFTLIAVAFFRRNKNP